MVSFKHILFELHISSLLLFSYTSKILIKGCFSILRSLMKFKNTLFIFYIKHIFEYATLDVRKIMFLLFWKYSAVEVVGVIYDDPESSRSNLF